MYTIKYSGIIVDIIGELEKDPKYEELFPILSFSFKDCKDKLTNMVTFIDSLRNK